jgi:hypothetical protein
LVGLVNDKEIENGEWRVENGWKIKIENGFGS